MINRNIFHIINNIVYELYRCRTYEELQEQFLPMLKLLVPYSYASIMRRAKNETPVRLVDPICVPDYFEEAEKNYMRYADSDFTGWLNCCRESTIFRESDLVGEQQRLRSPIYQKCYQKFDVFDSLNYGIVHNGSPLGCLSIFRRREDGPFTSEEMFYITSVGQHLNQHMAVLLEHLFTRDFTGGYDFSTLEKRYRLTGKELQLLQLLTRFYENREIAETMNIRESTLQKHFQNLFRKVGVSSRWELIRLLLDGDPRS